MEIIIIISSSSSKTGGSQTLGCVAVGTCVRPGVFMH
jgi:hypothetical protein